MPLNGSPPEQTTKRAASGLEDRIFLKFACEEEERQHVSQMMPGECAFLILHVENIESFGKV